MGRELSAEEAEQLLDRMLWDDQGVETHYTSVNGIPTQLIRLVVRHFLLLLDICCYIGRSLFTHTISFSSLRRRSDIPPDRRPRCRSYTRCSRWCPGSRHRRQTSWI